MRAVRFTEFGPADVLRVVDVPDPVPGPGEDLVRVTAIGVNYGETSIRSGKAARLFPWHAAVRGTDGRMGAEVIGVTADGRRLMGAATGDGYAELAVLGNGVEVPPHVGDHEALALLLQGSTAVQATRRSRLRAGERVLVEAAAGGVGSLLVQIAARAGAVVVAAARGEHKLALARELGAHETVDYSRAGWTEGVGEVDVVFSSVGGSVARQSFELLRPGAGRLVLFGFANGEPLDVTPAEVFGLGVELIGLWNPLTPENVREALDLGLKPVLGPTFPLADAARAHEALESRATTGKVILVP
ncbi:quinone oxidoreductase family protein [Saccharothrix obliqua]|uniref:quinone oxidoreductase family protein n=1 Tax=Saccharothrix obliqua TaxID=2861747 RepID=UPI001C5D0498|nr:zinc-binding dehydrogenase [Saccharothrix obliqua]MBW4720216.1 zinc-binding dehydrogenase [Saccharothrix obliqua]